MKKLLGIILWLRLYTLKRLLKYGEEEYVREQLEDIESDIEWLENDKLH